MKVNKNAALKIVIYEKTYKMSKAAGSSSPGNIKRVLYANSTTLVVIMCMLFVGPYVSATLSVIASVKVVVEVLCCYLLVVNLVLTVSLRDVELPPYRSQRTTSLKVVIYFARLQLPFRGLRCIIVLNFAKIGHTVAEISRFFDFGCSYYLGQWLIQHLYSDTAVIKEHHRTL